MNARSVVAAVVWLIADPAGLIADAHRPDARSSVELLEGVEIGTHRTEVDAFPGDPAAHAYTVSPPLAAEVEAWYPVRGRHSAAREEAVPRG
jgi:hypothetical protein